MSGKLTKAQRDLLEDCHRDERGMVGVVANFAPARILVSRGLAVWRDGEELWARLYPWLGLSKHLPLLQRIAMDARAAALTSPQPQTPSP